MTGLCQNPAQAELERGTLREWKLLEQEVSAIDQFAINHTSFGK
jgi:hypothetical protein